MEGMGPEALLFHVNGAAHTVRYVVKLLTEKKILHS